MKTPPFLQPPPLRKIIRMSLKDQLQGKGQGQESEVPARAVLARDKGRGRMGLDGEVREKG